MKATRILATKALTSFITSSTKTFPKQITRQFSTKATKTYRTIKDDDVSSGKDLLVVGGFAALVTSAIALTKFTCPPELYEIDELLGKDVSYALYQKWVSPMLNNSNSNESKPSLRKLLDNITSELISSRHKILNSNLDLTPDISKKIARIDTALRYIDCVIYPPHDDYIDIVKVLKSNSKIFKEVIDQAEYAVKLRNNCKYARAELDELLKSKSSQITKEVSKHIEKTSEVLDIVEGELSCQHKLRNLATPSNTPHNGEAQIREKLETVWASIEGIKSEIDHANEPSRFAPSPTPSKAAQKDQSATRN